MQSTINIYQFHINVKTGNYWDLLKNHREFRRNVIESSSGWHFLFFLSFFPSFLTFSQSLWMNKTANYDTVCSISHSITNEMEFFIMNLILSTNCDLLAGQSSSPTITTSITTFSWCITLHIVSTFPNFMYSHSRHWFPGFIIFSSDILVLSDCPNFLHLTTFHSITLFIFSTYCMIWPGREHFLLVLVIT